MNYPLLAVMTNLGPTHKRKQVGRELKLTSEIALAAQNPDATLVSGSLVGISDSGAGNQTSPLITVTWTLNPNLMGCVISWG